MGYTESINNGPYSSILEEWCKAIDAEYEETKAEIEELLNLIDPDECDIGYLKYIAGLLGESIPPTLNELNQREFLKNLCDYYKIKGTHLNAELRSKVIKDKNISLIELYKTQLFETTDYSSIEDVNHDLKSARIDVMDCSLGCETIDETVMNPAQAEAYLEDLGEVLPIHVLVKKEFETQSVLDELDYPDDYIGCVSSCETYCEGTCETIDETWDGSYVSGDFQDSMSSIQDNLIAIETCIYSCETECEDCCQCWGYKVIPEIRGEIYFGGVGYIDVRMRDVIPDDHTCTIACEAACEATGNQTDSILMEGTYLYFIDHIWYLGTIPGTAYWLYRIYMESGENFSDKYGDKEEIYWASSAQDCDDNDLTDGERQSVCTATCEDATCQSYCENNCESGCEVFCEAATCETSCEGVCQYDCQSACQALICQASCEGGCETAGAQVNDYLIIDGGELI